MSNQPASTPAAPASPDATTSEGLRRSLRSRHLTMIAIGGAIGTGLFVASGATISQAGPGGALVAYGTVGIMVWLIMQSLGEMAAYLPVAGSFGEYGTRFVSPSFGFAIGWNYWFNWAITVAAELVAAALVMKYWFPHTPSIVWSALFLLVLFVLNALSARAYGEGEFWFAAIKVTAVIVFLVLGVLMIAGIIGDSPGTAAWTDGAAPFVGGPEGILIVLLVAGYSFQGTELIGTAAGEAEHPETTIPRAIRTIFWRILLFYIGAIAVIGFLIPYTDPNLLSSSESNVAVSPFTLVFSKAGILGAASIMNAIILTSVLSAGTSGLYASTRMLFALAENGQAPQFLKKLSRHQVPMNALVATTLVGLAGFITSLVGDGRAYEFLLTVSALAGFITWAGISWCHWKFRAAFKAQGHSLDDLPYRARFFPAGAVVALVACLAIIAGQAYEPMISGASLSEILLPYIGIPVFFALWWGHKLITKAPAVEPATADLGRR
ncbi:MAG: amino acid permease [Actinomyces urogenitalis]|uniref:Amino acid permease n=3 Tax=Actinomyces urogenitalis TaxID=103621 RepID=C0W388_9ACTO|nr:amino acid permease [Actinomyces urogenitalis]EEH66805.1 amino acid permease [Actinomyces urogenitalis DSM 15434]KGE99577.1 gamma-aminobutyrate permease [Actinomyces urogenitalis S6-C4]KGE99650.1 gamma-aminobutyrate permease [Actinomyces urogenitalis S6-C4]MBS5976222.1 amino acid permease [Actinomyces urogenitalis]MBS6071609.1 amino acid permease [Actinomyces urogenitalis]